jgi:hypothetical protein
MKVMDYLYFGNITKKDFAKLSGVGLPTLYHMLRQGNCTLYNASKVVHATSGLVSYEDLLPDDLIESFRRDRVVEDSKPGQLILPSNEELAEKARKARWDSKFSGMCC